MKILLVNPECTAIVGKEFNALEFPINLGYIASTLILAGHEVKLLDLNVMNPQILKRYILEFQPEIVGVTAMTSTIYNAKRIIDETKCINNKIITILGGIHASALPIETMSEIGNLDYLVFGEGEETIIDLVDHLIDGKELSNVDGIVYRVNIKIIKNKPRRLIENLDDIPFPARHLVPMELYAHRHISRGLSRENFRIIELITGRGCPNQCIFCAGHINYGRSLRFRSYENITQEIDNCISQYKINHVGFEDDTFTLNRKLVKKLCIFLKKRNLTWNCLTRVNSVDYNLLKFMADSGCKKVTFGVESGSPEILQKIKKNITIPQIIQAVEEAKRTGIRFIECSFIVGCHPDETLKDINDTVKLIYKLMPDFIPICIMVPFPGTEIYDIMRTKQYLPIKPDWSQFSVFGNLRRFNRLTHLMPEQLVELQRKIMRNYYLSPKYLISQLKKTRHLNELKYFFKMAGLFFKEFIFKYA